MVKVPENDRNFVNDRKCGQQCACASCDTLFTLKEDETRLLTTSDLEYTSLLASLHSIEYTAYPYSLVMLELIPFPLRPIHEV